MDPIPALGEHTRSILAELGYSATEIEQLRATGAI
jgi:crotonobetainyl-CoA:carnitine CoA-transferase CaiB-like acyl-CoA transferase